VKTNTRRAVEAFAAADPARPAGRADERQRQQLLRTITATPRPLAAPRRTRRWRPRSVGFGIAIVALVGAGSVAAFNSGLPIGNDMIGKSAADARQEALDAAKLIPVAPGERDPGPGPLEGDSAQGAAAGQLLFRRMCTWDRRLLRAIAANDPQTIATTKAELARPLWYTYFAPSSADDVRRMHAEARIGNTAELEQFYRVNCRDVTGRAPRSL
jgi:hypothetical protein